MSDIQKGSGLSVVINNNGHISFNADTAFSIEKQEEPFSVHLADVITAVVLESIKGQVENARVFPGEFRLLLTGCISDITNVKEKQDAASNVEEANEEESTSEEAVEEAQETAEESNQEARTEPERTDED